MKVKEYIKENPNKKIFCMDMFSPFWEDENCMEHEVLLEKDGTIFIDKGGLQPLTYFRYRSIVEFKIKEPFYFSKLDINLDRFRYELELRKGDEEDLMSNIYVDGISLPYYLVKENIYTEKHILSYIEKRLDINYELKVPLDEEYKEIPPIYYGRENFLVKQVKEEVDRIEKTEFTMDIEDYQDKVLHILKPLVILTIILLSLSYLGYFKVILNTFSVILMLSTLFLLHSFYYRVRSDIKGVKLYIKNNSIYVKIKQPIKFKNGEIKINPIIYGFMKKIKLKERK